MHAKFKIPEYKIRRRTLVLIAIIIILALILCAFAMLLTFYLSKNAALDLEIQKKNLQIEALVVALEMDSVLKQIYIPENEIGEKNIIEISALEIKH